MCAGRVCASRGASLFILFSRDTWTAAVSRASPAQIRSSFPDPAASRRTVARERSPVNALPRRVGIDHFVTLAEDVGRGGGAPGRGWVQDGRGRGLGRAQGGPRARGEQARRPALPAQGKQLAPGVSAPNASSRSPVSEPPTRSSQGRSRPRASRPDLSLTSPFHPRDARFSTARPTTGPGWSRGCRCDPTSPRRIFPPSRARRPLTSADGSSRRETDRVSRRAARTRGGVPRAIHVARPSPSPHHHAPVIAPPPRFALHVPPVCTHPRSRVSSRVSDDGSLPRRKRARRRVSETPPGFCSSAATARRGS